MLCCCRSIIIFCVSYVLVIVKEASHEFRWGDKWLVRAQMRGLEVEMLRLSSYEEPLLSWYHMHIKSRCCHIEYKFVFVNWRLSCEYITYCWLLVLLLFMQPFLILYTTNIFEHILTHLLFYLCVDVRCV